MNISGILLHGSIRNVNLVWKDHYFPVSRVDFVGVVIGRLNNWRRYLIISLKIHSHNTKYLNARHLLIASNPIVFANNSTSPYEAAQDAVDYRELIQELISIIE